MTIGNKIVELRKKHKYTQEKLAEQLGISRQTLSSWESDITSPDLLQASKLVKILKISLDELVENDLEINAKDNLKNPLVSLIGKEIYITVDDDIFELCIDDSKPVRMIDVNDDFMTIEYFKNKKKQVKLVDMDLIISIKVVESDESWNG